MTRLASQGHDEGSEADRQSAQEWPPGSLLDDLTPTSRADLLALGVPRRYRPGEVLLVEGEYSTHVILLRAGHVKVTARLDDDQGVALLAIRAGGDTVGELAALDGRPRSATVTAVDRVEANVISKAELHDFLRRDSTAALALSRTVSSRLRSATRRRIDFAGCEVKVRLARILAELAHAYGRDTPAGRAIGVTLTQPELAALVGAAEVTVHKTLRDLRSEGIVATGYRNITVLDEGRLRKLAGLA
jgi:CRP-like cAMP-binding protein